MKSPDTAGDTAVADTSMVIAVEEARLRVAVTVLTSAFSEIDAGDSTSVTCGAPSSSVMVSV